MKKLKFGFKILFLLILSFLVKRFRHIPRNPANLLGFVCWQIFTITAMHCTSHLTSCHMPPSIFNAYIFFHFPIHALHSFFSFPPFFLQSNAYSDHMHTLLSFFFVCLFVFFSSCFSCHLPSSHAKPHNHFFFLLFIFFSYNHHTMFFFFLTVVPVHFETFITSTMIYI